MSRFSELKAYSALCILSVVAYFINNVFFCLITIVVLRAVIRLLFYFYLLVKHLIMLAMKLPISFIFSPQIFIYLFILNIKTT